ncbi:MAG: metal ABC transporter permease [Verrucomicrobia bacterium]|nr:metal ABC transporter permease [Verrucomicrobiota bacterium]
MSDIIPFSEFFTNPIFSIATIACMLMCFASSLIGVIAFVSRRSLIGETLAHATYPGVALALTIGGLFAKNFEAVFPLAILVGAFVGGFIGLKAMLYLEEKLSINSDTALCFVLSVSLGLGILLASRLQFSNPVWYQKLQMLLYGQAATMLLSHVILYAVLSLLVVLAIIFLFPGMKISYFDPDFASRMGVSQKWISYTTKILFVLAVVIGLRSTGVVLLSGMLIAPAVAARQFSKTLKEMFVWSAIFGTVSGFLGNYLSVQAGVLLRNSYPSLKAGLPTGPLILIVAAFIAFISLLLSRERGFIPRLYRIYKFQRKCLLENILKELYKKEGALSLKKVRKLHHLSRLKAYLLVWMLQRQGIWQKKGPSLELTEKGYKKAERVVRLHRLWEVYLFDYLGIDAANVHQSAEEMEHILTPELEKELTRLLRNPKRDPHNQIIPGEGVTV